MINLIPLPYKILAALVIVAATFSIGYYKGIGAGRVAQLKDTVAAYETRKDIDQDTTDLRGYDLCLTLPGVLPEQCDELRGLDTAPNSK